MINFVMSKKQKMAIKCLERAFKKCKDANLVFHGMDDSLLAWDRDDEKKRTENGKSICEQQYEKNGNQGIAIKTYDTYKDSGG